MYTTTIDWLSFTLHPDKESTPHVLQTIAGSGIMEPDKVRFGYERAARTEEGCIVLTAPSRPSMGVHVIVSGSALLRLRERGVDGLHLIREVLHDEGKVSRLDLAKDAKDETFGIMHFEKLAAEGQFEGTAHKAASVRSSDGGCTVYIGSRQSERFLRVYDKGIESKQGGDWIRAELELKGDTAHLVAQALLDQTGGVNDVFCAMARRMCDMQYEGWQDLLNAEGEFTTPKIEKQADREAWIEKQVADAVLKHFDEHPDSKAVARLFKLLCERYGVKKVTFE